MAESRKSLVCHWYSEYHILVQSPQEEQTDKKNNKKTNKKKNPFLCKNILQTAPNAHPPVRNAIIFEGFLGTGKQTRSHRKLFPFVKIRKKSCIHNVPESDLIFVRIEMLQRKRLRFSNAILFLNIGIQEQFKQALLRMRLVRLLKHILKTLICN